MSPTTVLLGDHELPVVAQRHARLRHLLRDGDIGAIFSADYGTHSYRVLCVLIPALADAMPEWEWDGYADEATWREGRYDPDADRSPTTAQIVQAFKTALRVNGGDEAGKLVELLRAGQQMVAQMATADAQSTTLGSPVSAGSTGA